MQVLSKLNVPVHTPSSCANYSGKQVVALREPLLSYVSFELMLGFEDRAYFYECRQPGCHGCGCPEFPRVSAEVPDYVLRHLELHVEFCEGVKRPKLTRFP